MVCVAQWRRRAVHYADYGRVEEITVASQRGTTDHARARVVSRMTSGAKVRLHFYKRVLHLADDTSGGPPRSLLGHDYTTTPDDRELLSTQEGESQIQNRWDVGCLLCRVRMDALGLEDGQCAPDAQSQCCVDTILGHLNAGTALDESLKQVLGS